MTRDRLEGYSGARGTLPSGERLTTTESVGGINLYPDVDPDGADFIEYDSMINLRRSRKNRSCGIEDEATRAEIVSIVKEWIA